jgi:hypothetical protein
MQPFGGHGRPQEFRQIAAMEMIVGRAEGRLDLRAERRALQRAAIIPAALVHGERSHADFVHRGLQSQPDQQARGVGADLDAGADLADGGRLLVDMDIETGLQQLQRGREATDASADDGDPHFCLPGLCRRAIS